MTKIHMGDRVITVREGEICKGVVKSVFDYATPAMLVVKLDDEEVIKISADNVAIVPKTETVEDPSENGERISITPAEYDDAVKAVISSKCKDNIEIGAVLALFADVLKQALFTTEVEND